MTHRQQRNPWSRPPSDHYRAGPEWPNACNPPAVLQHQELVESIEAIVWRCDALTFRFTFVSRQAEALLGYPVERWLNEPHFWEHAIHPDATARRARKHREVVWHQY